ncbi:hypothetical protein [uncultured Thiothrix sp.]|uniref:hypothetical protein n=1 Tax=uncultured Thiothrix sp. TaxID=223185 RepID=UPI0026202CE4|nr:hypothetical protein [uncultured Thiothrix sp.]HMT94764.1 hypothetical protein [Thiolinea sp.]
MEYFANRNGETTNSGESIDQAWPIAYALSGAAGKIRPGSTLNVDIDKVCPYELKNDDIHGPRTPREGFQIWLSGEENNKTIIKFTGHGIGSLPMYRGESGKTAWRHLGVPDNISPDLNLWEGQHIIQPERHAIGGYFVGTDDNIYPLTFSRYNNFGSIAATSQIYNSQGIYYTGPTIAQQMSGRPLIRLDPASPEAMLHKETISPPSLDPNECEFHLFVFDGRFLNVHGNHLIIDGLKVSYSYTGVLLQKTANHVTIRNSEIRGGINLIACGTASHWKIEKTILDGLLSLEKGHIAYGDIKAGSQPADLNKVTCINPSTVMHQRS